MAPFRLVAGTLVLVFSSILSPASADQTDERLGPLFEILLNTPENSPEAFAAQEQIWALWLQAPTASTRVLMAQGVAQMQQMEYADAITTFTALIQIYPDFAEAWNKRATIFYLMGNYADSLADIDETLDLEPRHFGAQSGKGLVFDAMQEQEAALEAYEKALRLNPHMPQIKTRMEQLREEIKGQQL